MTENKQYCRTHRAIQTAFLSLLYRKSFEDIRIQDILDTAPVSRATFYKHFRDKYEIAEKLQDEICLAWKEQHAAWAQAKAKDLPVLIERYVLRYRDMAYLLLRVRTDQVDLPAALDRCSREYYVETSRSPTKEVEARIYGAAVSAFLITLFDGSVQLPMESVCGIMLPVALRLLALPEDPEVADLLAERYRQKRNDFPGLQQTQREEEGAVHHGRLAGRSGSV